MTDSASETANIGPRQIAHRRNYGMAMVIICIAIEAAFSSAQAGRWWRLVYLPLLYIGLMGILQAQGKT